MIDGKIIMSKFSLANQKPSSLDILKKYTKEKVEGTEILHNQVGKNL